MDGLMTKLRRQTDQTIQDFDKQWALFDDQDHGYYGSNILDDILTPILPQGALKDTTVADIGSGTGRIVRMLLQAGVKHVTAIEPAPGAFIVLQRNTQDIADRIRYLNVDGSQIPSDGFDYIFSIGVIHHIADPAPTLKSALDALAPGGELIIWVYGKEGNEIYLAIVQPLRAVTKRLPDLILRGLSWLLFVPLWLYICVCRVLPLPMRRYMRNVLAHLTPKQLVLNIFDQLNPAYAKYYSRGEARQLLTEAGFSDVKLEHRHGYSWTVCGTKGLHRKDA